MTRKSPKFINAGIIFFFFFLLTGALQAKDSLRDLSVSLPAQLQGFLEIRILVLSDQSQIKMSTPGAFQILDNQGQLLFVDEKLGTTTVQPVASGIQWGERIISEKFILVKSPEAGIKVVDAGFYRGVIFLVKNEKGTLDVINKLNFDDYLKSVISFEANPKWGAEALKAQAVVARTFAFTRMIERQQEPYDVKAGVLSQVYVGKNSEDERASRAVDATHGQVLMYRNKLFPAYYHSTCGGATAAADLVWRVKRHGALQGVPCKFCENSPHYRWEATVTSAQIKEKLAKHGLPVQEVLNIQTGKVDRTGRAHEFIIQSTWAKRSVDADAFRVWIDPMHLKSNQVIRIRKNDDGSFTFKGKGWGHGVGLCQFGMKYLAEIGYSYQDILGYYYPGAQVVDLKEFSNMPIKPVSS